MSPRRSILLAALLSLGPIAAAQEPWPRSFATGDDAACQVEVAQRLASGLRDAWPTLGLEDEALREVQGEFDLRLLAQLTEHTGNYVIARDALRTFLTRAHAPGVEARATWLLATSEWHLGNAPVADETRARIGFLEDWWIVGPFDNERGGAFDTPLGPEEAFDIDASYPGKRGPVSWRRWSQLTPRGSVPLGALLKPAQEALAYLTTHVHVPTAQTAVLRVSGSGSFAVWVNGSEVARGDHERPYALDQNAVVVQLGSGWNQIGIKSGQTKGEWELGARLTTLDGTAMLSDGAGTTCAAQLPEGAQRAVAGATGAPDADPAHAPTPRARLDALELLEQATPGPTRDLIAGALTAWRAAHDQNTHPERALFQRALTARPELALAHELLAATYDTVVSHSAEREENRWRQHHEQALASDPACDRARLALADYYTDRFGNLTRAAALLAPVLTGAKVPWQALDLAARGQREQFGPAAAELLERQLLARCMAGELAFEVRLRWIRRLLAQGRLGEAEPLLAAGLAVNAVHPQLVAEQMQFFLRAGRVDEARAHLQRQQELQPFAREPALLRMRFERSANDPGAALAAVERALAVCPDDDALLREQGDLLIALDRRDAALACYERALELDPNQPRVREALDRLRGPQSVVAEPHRIVPDEIIAEALRAAEPENTPSRILLDNQAVRIATDGTAQRYHQLLVKLVNEEGCRAFDGHAIPYAAGEQWVKVLTARVHHLDGRTEQARIRNRPPAARPGEYPVWSTTWVDLPPLRPGEVIEIEWRTDDLKQSFFGDYFGDRVLFGGLEPRARTIYTIDAPTAKALHFHASGMPGEPQRSAGAEGRTIYRWELANQARIDPEPGMPPVTDLAPYVEVSTFRDWNAFARWYRHLIRQQFHSSPAIEAKVRELTAASTTDEERVRAIHGFVVSEVRYIAWEFGVHGFQPYRADTIFTRGFGDCKDKATLLCTMLDEVDIEAYPVLIFATRQRPEEDLTLPLIHHFNHCIAYVPGLREGGWFLDGTAEHHRADDLPLMDRGARVLVVKEDGGLLADVAWNTPSEQAVGERQHARLDRRGAAELTVEQQPTGDYAVYVRDRLEVQGERKRLLEQRFGSRFPGATVEEVTMSDLTDLTRPVTWRVTLQVPEYWDEVGGTLRLPPLADFFDSTAGLTGFVSRGERQHDLLLGNPSASTLVLEIELPEGTTPEHLPQPVTLEDARGRFTFRARVEGRTLTLERSLELRVARVPVAQYPAFKEFLDEINEALAERVTLRRLGGVN